MRTPPTPSKPRRSRSASTLAVLVALGVVVLAAAPLGDLARSQDGTGEVEPGATLEAPPPEGEAAPADETLPAHTVVIDVDSPERSLYRIAVPNVLGDASMGPEGAEVLRNDFRLVSLFDVLDPRTFVADLEAEGLEITAPNWSVVGAQAVIKGEITRTASGISVEMRLYELASGTTATLTRTYTGAKGQGCWG